ncbi:MAG: hypothetical protein ACI9G1_000558, partial [Pirellulaceae bacterium]
RSISELRRGRLHPTAFELRYHSISMAETR